MFLGETTAGCNCWGSVGPYELDSYDASPDGVQTFAEYQEFLLTFAPSIRYVVYRTVDGSRQFWRGRTAALSFDDSLRDGTIEYFVASKRGNERTEPTPCG